MPKRHLHFGQRYRRRSFCLKNERVYECRLKTAFSAYLDDHLAKHSTAAAAPRRCGRGRWPISQSSGCRAYICEPEHAQREPTAWLGM